MHKDSIEALHQNRYLLVQKVGLSSLARCGSRNVSSIDQEYCKIQTIVHLDYDG